MIELRQNNLFITGREVVFSNGDSILLRDDLSISQFTNYDYYIVERGDELTAIAFNVYKRKVKDASKLWWVIADVNRIHKPWDLSELIGKDLYIPDINELKLLLEDFE